MTRGGSTTSNNWTTPSKEATKELTVLIAEFLRYHDYPLTLQAFASEHHTSRPAVPVLAGTEIPDQILQAFDAGRTPEFFDLWHRHVPAALLNSDAAARRLEFHIQVYFAVYPHLSSALPRTDAGGWHQEAGPRMRYLQTYLTAQGHQANDPEFLSLYALPFVPQPQAHPSFAHLFQPEWASDVRLRLQCFVDGLHGRKGAMPRLYHLLYCAQHLLPAQPSPSMAFSSSPAGSTAVDVTPLLKGEVELDDLVPPIQPLAAGVQLQPEPQQAEATRLGSCPTSSGSPVAAVRQSKPETLEHEQQLQGRQGPGAEEPEGKEGEVEGQAEEVEEEEDRGGEAISVQEDDEEYSVEMLGSCSSPDVAAGRQGSDGGDGQGAVMRAEAQQEEGEGAAAAAGDAERGEQGLAAPARQRAEEAAAKLEPQMEVPAGVVVAQPPMRSVVQQALLPALDYARITHDLHHGSDRAVCSLVQALRWRLVCSPPGLERRSVAMTFAQVDLLCCRAAPSLALALSARRCSEVRLELARLLNAIASDPQGRTYLLSGAPTPAEGVLDCLLRMLMDGGTLGPAAASQGLFRDSPLQRQALAALQKLSLRRAAQLRLVDLGLLRWLVHWLLEDSRISSFSLEYGLSAIMNCCLTRAGRIAAEDCAALLELLEQHLLSDSAQIRSYVNATLFALLERAALRALAQSRGLRGRLEAAAAASPPVFQRQIQHVLARLRAEAPDCDDSEVDGGEVDWPDEAEYACEESAESLAHPLEQLYGEQLLCERYAAGAEAARGQQAALHAAMAGAAAARRGMEASGMVLDVQGAPLQRPVTPSLPQPGTSSAFWDEPNVAPRQAPASAEYIEAFGTTTTLPRTP